jgi:hypothetical protein
VPTESTLKSKSVAESNDINFSEYKNVRILYLWAEYADIVIAPPIHKIANVDHCDASVKVANASLPNDGRMNFGIILSALYINPNNARIAEPNTQKKNILLMIYRESVTKKSESAHATADNDTSSGVSTDKTESVADTIDAVLSVSNLKNPFVPISLGMRTLLNMPIIAIANEITNGRIESIYRRIVPVGASIQMRL